MTDYSKLSREALIEELQQLQRHSQQAEDQGRAAQLAEELRVHQVELEMQNRELRESQQLLEEARVRYADLYDFAPVGYLIVDQRGRIDEINLTAASMLDQPRANLIGLPLTGWLRSPDIKRFFDFLRALGGAGRLTVSGLQLVTRASPNRHLRLKGTTIENGEEAPPRFRIALIDITTSHNAEQALRGSERRYRSLFDDSPLPLWEVDLFAVRDLLAGLPEPQSMSLGDVPRRDRPIIHQCIRRMRIVDVNQAALELVAMPRKDHLLQGIAALLTARS
ncbi:MAG: PAS domain-containing protein [Pseudomonadota bacterium]|nr:MAG: PAS domain-containing protein [Pseudomonadota bacterium]